MRALVAAGLLVAVVIGGFALGAIQAVVDTSPDW